MSRPERTTGGNTSHLDGVSVSIDSYTLDITAGKRRLKTVEQDGTLTYEEPKAPEVKITEYLERIWNEYPDGLLDLTEAKLEQRPGEEVAIKEKQQEEEAVEMEDPSKMMTWEEMVHLRSEIFLQLNDARNELWCVLELAKTLAASTSFTIDPPAQPGQTALKKAKKPSVKTEDVKSSLTIAAVPTEPPILPAGTYTATPSFPPARPPHLEAYELELALAAKQQALDECSLLIDSAVDELQSMAAAGEQFWGSVRTLRDGDRGRGQWALLPKPDFSRSMAEGERARDVIIPYAVDEAPAALRARSLAAFDLDPVKKDALAFGSRSYLRLRVTLIDADASFSSSVVPGEDTSDVRVMIANAQVEAFEEELYTEIRREATHIGNAIVEPRSVVLDVDKQKLIFEMYDTRTSPSSTATSLTCDLLLLSARLCLLRLHRQRKARLLDTSSDSAALPSIISSLFHVLRYHGIVQQLTSVFELFSSTLQKAGVAVKLVRRFSVVSGEGRDALELVLRDDRGLEALGGVVSLEIEGCAGISVTISVLSALAITTSRATFSLADIDELPYIVADDISLQLLGFAVEVILQDIEDEPARSQVFMDDLEGVVSAGPCGSMRISLPPPFRAVQARLETGYVQPYNSVSGTNIRDWLGALAARVAVAVNEES